MMNHPGWLLVMLGVLLVAIGLISVLAPSVPWLGKLPGDIALEKGNARFYFPLTTCIVLSVLLTGILWIVRYFLP
jgi:hypothetical protein